MKNQNHQKQEGKNPVSFSGGHKILLFQSLFFSVKRKEKQVAALPSVQLNGCE